MKREDSFRLLGLDPGATDDQVRAAFRRKLMQHHPDTASAEGGGPDVKEIIEAYRSLVEASSRLRHGPSRASPDPSGWKARVRRSGSDDQTVESRAACPVCDGSGVSRLVSLCPACGGRAEITALDGDRARIIRCGHCSGMGRVSSSENCQACSGSGFQQP